MLHQARTFQNSRLVGLALKHLSVKTLHNSLQVGCQFHLLSCDTLQIAVTCLDGFYKFPPSKGLIIVVEFFFLTCDSA